MYVIGAKALADFSAAHPDAAPDLRALAARLAAGDWADARALAAAFGGCAETDGEAVTLSFPWRGVRVRLAFDAAAQLVVVREVGRIRRSVAKE